MFNKKMNTNERINTLIGENTKIIGNIKGEGAIRVDGELEGDLDYDGNVVIGDKGKVSGNIHSINTTISGIVFGNIECNSTLTILSNGNLHGDIQVSNLVISEDATFEGLCKMKKDKPNSPQIKKAD